MPKPEKPYPSFPLTPHVNGQFVKKIAGRLHYFGTIGSKPLPATKPK